MTYQEIKDRLSKCELTLEKLKNGNLTSKDVQIQTEKLNLLKESYLKLLKEAEKGVIYTDDEKKAKDLADDGANVKLTKEQDGIEFSLDETKAIAKKVGQAVAKALNSLGDEVGHMKAKKIEPNSFEIYVEYKNDNEDQFSFYISDDTLHLVDFSFDKEITDVGVKPSGEAVVNVDVIANELQKHFKSLSEKVDKLSNTEDLNEAPDDMYYIKVKKTDKASLNGLQDVIETWYSPVKFADIVDDDGAGNVIFYLKKSDWDPGMEDDIMGNGVQIVDTNMPLSEAKETDDYGRPHVDPKGSRTYLDPEEMQPSKRFEKMAQKEDTDIGHQDDEPDMLQSTAFETAQYAAKLVKKLQKYDQHDGEVDFPNWWQAKLILAKDYMQKAYHYLASEEAQPAIDQLALEGKYKSDAQRKAIYATKAEKGELKEELTDDQRDALEELEDILNQAGDLGNQARDIIAQSFPNYLSQGDAYGAFNFGDSSNSYDTTLSSIVQSIYDGDEDEDLDEDDNPVPQGKHIKVDDMQFMHDQIVSRMKMLAKIYKEKGPEATVMLGPNNDREVKVIDTLKILTKKKRELEDALQNKVAGIGKDQELDERQSHPVMVQQRIANTKKAKEKEKVKEAELSKSEKSKLKDIVKQLKKSVKGHGNQAKYIDSLVKKEAAPGYKHDCAAKVVHEKYGAGTCIPEKHTLIKEGDKFVVTHYDVLFESGETVEDIPVSELEIKTQKEHWHKGYKKKKK